MANGYGDSPSGYIPPKSSTYTTIEGQKISAPDGFHYMPDGTLMSNETHEFLYRTNGVINNFNLKTSNIKVSGEKRPFNILGNGTFSLEIKNESGSYYNFVTHGFQATPARLSNQTLKGFYNGYIQFPPAPATEDTLDGAISSSNRIVMDTNVADKMEVGDRVTGNDALDAANVTVTSLNPDDDNAKEAQLSEAVTISDGVTLTFTGSDQYDVFLFAEPGTTHEKYNEVRFNDNSLDINSSTGSNSLLLRKVIYQTLNHRLTFAGVTSSVSVPTGFAGLSNNSQTAISAQTGSSTGKIPFSFEIEGGSTHSFRVERNPTINDVFIKSRRTIGSFVAIKGEDVSASTYYSWSMNNVDGITAGMIPVGTNITPATVVSSYEDDITELVGYKLEKRILKVKKKPVDIKIAPIRTLDSATKTITTVQAGNIVFSEKQAAALDSDVIHILGYGAEGIKSLTGWDIELTDITTTLTKPTALVTTATQNSTTVSIDNADGIMDDISTVSSFNIDSSVAEPTVTTIGSYTGSTATLTLSSAQSFEAGETLTFNGSARKITISGNIKVISAGSTPAYWDGILSFDLEKFITATDES